MELTAGIYGRSGRGAAGVDVEMTTVIQCDIDRFRHGVNRRALVRQCKPAEGIGEEGRACVSQKRHISAIFHESRHRRAFVDVQVRTLQGHNTCHGSTVGGVHQSTREEGVRCGAAVGNAQRAAGADSGIRRQSSLENVNVAAVVDEAARRLSAVGNVQEAAGVDCCARRIPAVGNVHITGFVDCCARRIPAVEDNQTGNIKAAGFVDRGVFGFSPNIRDAAADDVCVGRDTPGKNIHYASTFDRNVISGAARRNRQLPAAFDRGGERHATIGDEHIGIGGHSGLFCRACHMQVARRHSRTGRDRAVFDLHPASGF